MRTRRAGFTLVEFMIVAVLTAIVLGGIYQTLASQERTYMTARVMIQDQEALRTAMGILESELREISSIGGVDIGGSDLLALSSDSIVIRAHRKTAFLCAPDPSNQRGTFWVLGDPFEDGDSVFLFVDNQASTHTDDRWDTTVVSSVGSIDDAQCDSVWSAPPQQRIRMDNQSFTGVVAGAPIRAYQTITYGLYDFGPLGYGLGRRRGGNSPTYLVGGLAGRGSGLQFTFYKPSGFTTLNPDSVSRIQVTIRTAPAEGTGVDPDSMTSTLYLRNN